MALAIMVFLCFFAGTLLDFLLKAAGVSSLLIRIAACAFLGLLMGQFAVKPIQRILDRRKAEETKDDHTW